VKVSADLRAFQDRIGHVFRDAGLLTRALTHPSIATATRPDNQRLEFLGDRVLGLTIATALYRADDSAEGQMAPRFNALVRRETCAAVALSCGLGDVLKLGRSEMISGGRKKETLLADAMEAVLAAVYQDAGFTVAEAVVLRLWAAHLDATPADPRDAKTRLQEWAQGRGDPAPVYDEAGRDGPAHALTFTVCGRLADGRTATATGRTKRAAEQAVAAILLQQVQP
jgi:ribonuclease III